MAREASTRPDPWSEWLLRGRQQGLSEAQVRRQHRALARIRDRIVRGARVRPGQRVLDVGAGTGLLALGGCCKAGANGAVYALDISPTALQEALRLRAAEPNGAPLSALTGEATALPLADRSFDAVLTRSVLIYVADKAAVAREFFRVLKPGGRASIFEPINSVATGWQQENRDAVPAELRPDYDRISAYQQETWPHRAAMLEFDERDLVRHFAAAGFDVQLTYEHVERRIRPPSARGLARWRAGMAAALARRGNPTMLSYAEAAEAVLGSAASEHLRRLIDARLMQPPRRTATGLAYLVARRPD